MVATEWLMPVDFLQKQARSRRVRHTNARAFRTSRRRRELQPKAEFAADSLQIAQRWAFDAIVDCSFDRALEAPPAPLPSPRLRQAALTLRGRVEHGADACAHPSPLWKSHDRRRSRQRHIRFDEQGIIAPRGRTADGVQCPL